MSDTPIIHPAGDTVVSVKDLLDMQGKIGRGAIVEAMASGALPSRLVGGPVGRVTTWSAFLRWAEGHDATKETGPVTRVTRTDEGVDG